MRALNFVILPLCIIDLNPQSPVSRLRARAPPLIGNQMEGRSSSIHDMRRLLGEGSCGTFTPAAALRPPSTQYRTCIIQDPPLIVERSKQALSGWALVWPRAFRFQVHMQGCFRQVCFFLPMKMFRPFECNAFGKFVHRILSDMKSNTYARYI